MGIYVLFSQLACKLIHSCKEQSLNYAVGHCDLSNPISLPVLSQSLLCASGGHCAQSEMCAMRTQNFSLNRKTVHLQAHLQRPRNEAGDS